MNDVKKRPRAQTKFGLLYKKYRRPTVKNCKEDLSEVLDPRCVKTGDALCVLETKDGVRALTVNGLQGLVILPEFLSNQEQASLLIKSLRDWTKSKYNNITNISGEYKSQDFWRDSNDLETFRRLTWVNVGTVYDWTNRKYLAEISNTPLPTEFFSTCEAVCQKVGGLKMTPETAIINYYAGNQRRPMGGHRDDAEDSSAPVVSISIGCEAIFLIGLEDDEGPIYPFFLRSGDVMLMSKISRWAVHGVARVSSGTAPEQLLSTLNDMERADTSQNFDDWERIHLFAKTSRININCRQVVRGPDEPFDWYKESLSKRKRIYRPSQTK